MSTNFVPVPEDDNTVVPTSEIAQKAVVHLMDGTIIRGEIPTPAPKTIDDALGSATSACITEFELIPCDGGPMQRISIEQIKAVFVVHSWQGDPGHQHIRFCGHDHKELGLWVEVRFADGEIIEGITYNSVQHLVSPGFLLTPTDPGCNNRVIYVNKQAITSFRVLGLRKLS